MSNQTNVYLVDAQTLYESDAREVDLREPTNLVKPPGYTPLLQWIRQGCSGFEAESQPENQSDSSASGTYSGDRNLNCAGFEAHEQAQRVLKQDPSDPHYLDADDVACEELQP